MDFVELQYPVLHPLVENLLIVLFWLPFIFLYYLNIYAVVGRYLITKDDPVGAAPPTNVNVVVDIV